MCSNLGGHPRDHLPCPFVMDLESFRFPPASLAVSFHLLDACRGCGPALLPATPSCPLTPSPVALRGRRRWGEDEGREGARGGAEEPPLGPCAARRPGPSVPGSPEAAAPAEETRHPGKERSPPGGSLFSPALLTSSEGCCGVPGYPAARLTGGAAEAGCAGRGQRNGFASLPLGDAGSGGDRGRRSGLRRGARGRVLPGMAPLPHPRCAWRA